MRGLAYLADWFRNFAVRVTSSRKGLWALGATALWMNFKTSLAVALFLGPPAAVVFFASGASALAALLFIFRPLWSRQQLSRAQAGLEAYEAETRSDAAQNGAFISWRAWEISPAIRQAVEAKRPEGNEEQLILGEVDGDGRLWSPFGAFPGFEQVSKEEFLPRHRFGLDLVLSGDRVVVRKDYRGNRQEMIHETFALSRLAEAANVPNIHRMEIEDTVLQRSFAAGDTINDLLVRAGARIQLAQTENDPELEGLKPHKRLEAILARGTQQIPKCLSPEFLASIQAQVKAIHDRRVAGLSLTFGNLVVDTDRDQPWFIDFDGARTYHPSPFNVAFTLKRWEDLSKLKRLYGLG